jgi:hypothetical protein
LAKNGLHRVGVPTAIQFPLSSVTGEALDAEIVATTVSDREGRFYFPSQGVSSLDETWAL